MFGRERSAKVLNSATISAVLAIGNRSRSATWTAILLPWLGGDRRPRPHGPRGLAAAASPHGLLKRDAQWDRPPLHCVEVGHLTAA